MIGFLFTISFAYVFLKSAQQKNVIGGHVWFIGPLSFGMAFCEVYGITAYVSAPDHKLQAAMAIGAGGWLGCVVAMVLHDRVFKRKDVDKRG